MQRSLWGRLDLSDRIAEINQQPDRSCAINFLDRLKQTTNPRHKVNNLKPPITQPSPWPP